MLYLYLCLTPCLAYLASLRVDWHVQMLVSIFLLLAMLVLRSVRNPSFRRILFLALSSFIVIRYFFWRFNYTLEYQDFFSFFGAITLFTAECYGGVMFFLSVFVNISPHQRESIPLPLDTNAWPSIDVLIPSYNESVDLVKITLAAATNIDYPKHKLTIYLLDDGATTAKLEARDDRISEAAKHRKGQLMAVCSELNVRYLSRTDNEHAKAGNLNAALSHIDGDLILVLDADHAPATDILIKTAGAFVADQQVFLVQTPHFFINPDPIEKNLDLFNRMPSENYMFYQAIQKGLDFWESSFFCGSAAVLRRTAIDAIGGFRGVTITEDSETALLLHSQGWKSHYLMCPLISGLQPETFTSFMLQRIRWAQGMVQNFIFHNPLVLPNLKIWQRMSYLSNMLFWFFPFARVVLLISPGLYLFFGLKIYNANFYDFIGYTLPYLVALLFTNHYLFSKVRWVFVSEIYETMQSLFSIRAVWEVLKNPRHPKFSVTPKRETLERDFISPLAIPFYWAILVTITSIFFGIARLYSDTEEKSLVLITLVWAIFNMLLLLSALGALLERKQRRINPRIPVSIQSHWVARASNASPEIKIPVVINDLSMGGSNLSCSVELLDSLMGKNGFIEVLDTQNRLAHRYKAEITNGHEGKEGFIYGIRFIHGTISEFVDLVRFVHGDSQRWTTIQQIAGTDPGLFKSMIFMTRIGIQRGFSHFKWIVTSTRNKSYDANS